MKKPTDVSEHATWASTATPSPSFATQKQSVRSRVRAVLKTLTPEIRAAAALQVCDRVLGSAEWREAGTVLLYAPLGDEVDLSALITRALADGKRVALPQFDPVTQAYRAGQIQTGLPELSVGLFGIREPAPEAPGVMLNQLDFAIIPGIAFDAKGHRLGRGRGYYDRLLMHLPGVKCGVGYDQQLVAAIPVEPHDIMLDCIVTPSRWLDVRP